MQFLVSNFTEDQLDRYAMYRRASFPKVFSWVISLDLSFNSIMYEDIKIRRGGEGQGLLTFYCDVLEPLHD